MKSSLGQFYTTNYEYIFTGLNMPASKEVVIIEPFVGKGDLLSFAKNYEIELYDIDPKIENANKRDTLLNPPDYKDKFILTNPPYLARNKSKNKEIFDKYKTNDLYKCFIKSFCDKRYPIGGILIIPLNFWSSIRKADVSMRKMFLNIFNVVRMNIFEEKVFDDTSYTVCSFQFELKSHKNKIPVTIFPSLQNMNISLNEKNDFSIGGKIYKLSSKKFNITRLTTKNVNSKNTNLVVRCIDNNASDKIKMYFAEDEKDIYIDDTPKMSARTFATLVITPEIDVKTQKRLAKVFNKTFNKYREKYNSLFLTNYRESKDIARKRVSFDLVYNLSGFILDSL